MEHTRIDQGIRLLKTVIELMDDIGDEEYTIFASSTRSSRALEHLFLARDGLIQLEEEILNCQEP